MPMNCQYRIIESTREQSWGGGMVKARGDHLILNRQSSEIQGTALGKCLRAWSCIYRSMPVGVVQSRHTFVGGTESTWQDDGYP